MRLKVYGGGSEVGRSMFKIEKDGKELGLEAGIKLGKEIEYPLIKEEEIAENIVISHCHLDHVGYLVHIDKKLNLYSTKPTRDLIPVLVGDYSKLANIKFNSNALTKKVKIIEYKKALSINSFKVEMFNAGHIIGSAMIKIDDVLYTGDFNTRSSKILDPAEFIKAKTLIVESTYSGRDDLLPPMKKEVNRLAEIINKTIKRGGVVLIPSFAIGRAQEILITLDSLMKSGIITKVPIFIDGMIKKAMKVYRMNVIYARKDIQNQILMSLEDPFRSSNFKVSKSKERKDVKAPCIIVTTSGMLTGGPVYKYLKMFGKDEKSTIVFVGYQAEGTPGREILEGKRKIVREDEEIEIGMEINRIRVSGHCDRNDLLRFIKTTKPKKVILVHGEKKKQEQLAEDLEDYEVIIPKNKEEIEI